MTEEFIGCIEEELKEIELFYEENGVEVEAYTLHNGSFFQYVVKGNRKGMPDFNHYNNAISERIFILSIHEQKAKGNLKGNTSEEQYDYYEKKYLNNATYIKSLLQEYPELKRLLELKNNSIQRAECEIRKSLYAEKEQIQKYSVMEESFPGLWEFTCRKAIHTEEDEVWRR